MKKQKLMLSVIPMLFLSTLCFNDSTSAIVNSTNNDAQIKTTTQNASFSFASLSGSGGGSSGSSTISSSSLVATKETSLSSYGGLVKYTSSNQVVYTSASWLVGIIGHTYETKITSITKVQGVYSHLQFISRELLLSGSSLTSLNTYTYSAASEEAMYFYNSVEGKIEASLYASASFGGTVSASTSAKTAVSYKSVKTQYYTRKTVQTSKYTTITSLNSTSAQYCPTGYAITVGQHGTYYEVEATAQIYQNWWWNSHKAYGDPIDVSFIICDVSSLITDYVYKKDTGSSTLYYLN